MPQNNEIKTPAATDPLAVIGEALKAAGVANATLRKSDGVHDAVIIITIPKMAAGTPPQGK
jgi:hypothetical protein